MSSIRSTMARQSGFTLIEVMVVVVILGILAAMVVPSVIGKGDQARAGTTESTIATAANALDMYRLDNGKYPTTQEGLDALINKPASAKNWVQGGYLRGGLPKDGWGNDLQYISPGSNGRPYD
ncbi:MAG: type II secretion system major pseudopilin GspG, partial [Pseudomonadota bacterium]|nr:type II secretion system major pseudopilin GspG [Pseudomonadota bacterium]